MQLNGRTVYTGSCEFDHVVIWSIDAETEAARLNRAGYTRGGKFVAGSFTVQNIEGRVPAVVGTLTGRK